MQAKEELDALKSSDNKEFKIEKEDEKMDDEDLMLPTDLFGDDLFKNLMSGEEIGREASHSLSVHVRGPLGPYKTEQYLFL